MAQLERIGSVNTEFSKRARRLVFYGLGVRAVGIR